MSMTLYKLGRLLLALILKVHNLVVFFIDDASKAKEFSLGFVQTISMNACEHVTSIAEGSKVLGSTTTSVQQFNSKDSRAMGTVSLGGHVCGFQSYQSHLYVALETYGQGDKVSVFDEGFLAKRHWTLEGKVCDLAVNNEKVYLAGTVGKLYVYTIHGIYLYEITEWFGTRLASHPLPGVILLTNQEGDEVMAINGETKKHLWTSFADKPWGVAVDDYEDIWVWSEFQQSVVIFDAEGA